MWTRRFAALHPSTNKETDPSCVFVFTHAADANSDCDRKVGALMWPFPILPAVAHEHMCLVDERQRSLCTVSAQGCGLCTRRISMGS